METGFVRTIVVQRSWPRGGWVAAFAKGSLFCSWLKRVDRLDAIALCFDKTDGKASICPPAVA